MIRKASGLDDQSVRQPLVPSGTNLLWLVKHLTMVEALWFQHAFAGLDQPLPAGQLEPADTTESVIAGYREAIRVSDQIIAGCDDLDRRWARAAVAPEPMSPRWVLVHMIEETGRHAGHADIIREQLDGHTGR